MKHRIFLLDAFAILYRAHFAFIKNPRITSKGLNTSSIFGFTNTLLEILNKEHPSHFAVAFDLPGNTFRHDAFEAYKAQREEAPEDIVAAVPYVFRLLDALNIPALSAKGFEADDVIGTLSAKLPADEFEVYMVTPDKDYGQLVKENVFLYRPRTRESGYDVMGAKEIEEKYGVPPHQVADWLGLMGDSSDNIPGLPKVGEKTALELIRQFGSVENVIARADEITKNALRETVKTHYQKAIDSKMLATIRTDVELEWSEEMLRVKHADLDKLSVLMQELEFRTLTDRIMNSRLNPMVTATAAPKSAAATAPAAQQMDLFGTAPAPVLSGKPSFDAEKVSYKLLTTAEERAAVRQQIMEAGRVCFDTETTGLDTLTVEVVALVLATKPQEAFLIRFDAKDSREQVTAILQEFQEILASDSILKIGQNLKYDIPVLMNYGITVAGPMFDTMVAHYIVNPDAKHGMDAMAQELLGYTPISIKELIGTGKVQKSMRDVPVQDLVNYACEDADITLQLADILAPKVKDNFVFERIEQPLVPVLTDMEREGICIDNDALVRYSEELGQRMKVLETDIIRAAGEEFNLNSPKQLGEILFDKLKLGKPVKTKTGQYSTDESVLQELAHTHELPGFILAYRGLQKLKSTYVDALPRMIHPKTGRVHTTFRQTVAVTGRLSSENPNLQNIPIRTQDGQEIRKAFVPRNSDFVLLSADYSQVELRIMAALSGDQNMIHAFETGLDIHRATAAKVFGVAPEEVTSQQRSGAKTVNFGIIYGISAFGLADRMGISRKEAKALIDTYFEQYPAVKAYMDGSIVQAREKGYTETFFGRRRALPDLYSNNATTRGFAERNAINSPIQGTAADIVKLAMIAIHREMTAANLRSKMVLQVHDELVFDVYRPEIEQVKAIVAKEMPAAANVLRPLGVPLEVEIGTGNNWLEAH